jgi:hypothetical protein
LKKDQELFGIEILRFLRVLAYSYGITSTSYFAANGTPSKAPRFVPRSRYIPGSPSSTTTDRRPFHFSG